MTAYSANVNAILFLYFVISFAKSWTAIFLVYGRAAAQPVHAGVRQQTLCVDSRAEGEQLWDGDGQREAKGWLSGQGDTSESRGPLGRMGVATAALGQEQSEVCLWVLSPRGGQEENRLCPCWFHFCWAGTRQGRATAKKYSHLCFCKCKL